ncbi:MAG: H(+)/Cl(-) exchange transporter ClcA [Phycisphaeraceae bacterium]|nr:H(+)/Cl(-) exchange transporter ClcA [Phycisphaeraceae bacterium]
MTGTRHEKPEVAEGAADSAEFGPSPRARSSRKAHFLRAGVVGLLSGAIALAFKIAVTGAEHGRSALLAVLHDHPAWGWAVLPVVGLVVGSLVGWITQRFAPSAAGSGIPHLKGVLLHTATLDWRRILPVKFIGGALGIGAGLSLGREGPTVHMGAAVAQVVSRVLRVPAADVPQLLSAGAGAGLAAAFNAPLAGLVFVIEELHRELSSRTAAGGLVAAVCATLVAHSLSGDVPSFEVTGLQPIPVSLLPWVVVLGLVAGVGGVAFNKALLGATAFSYKVKKVPRWALPGVVCAAAGLIGWWMPLVPGGGHALAESILTGKLQLGIWALVVLLGMKFLLTAASYGSGPPGGIFAPMLVLGTLLGGVFAEILPRVSPALAGHSAALSVLCMGAFFVSSVRAPMTGIVLISEMTGGYTLLFPLCLVAIVAYLTAEALRDRPVYEALMEQDMERRGKAATVEARSVYIGVQSGSPVAEKRIAQAGFPRGCLVVGVERAGRWLHPAADLEVLPGDHITVMVPAGNADAMTELARLCTGL